MQTNKENSSSRIEYIDALRGFTMILVVLQHVATFGWGISDDMPSIHPYLQQFRMPLFFFISGFVLYKTNVIWNVSHVRQFLSKKFLVQIIPTIVFLILFCKFTGWGLVDSLFDPAKAGYWFTYTLFVFFVFYSILRLCFHGRLEDIAIVVAALFFYVITWKPVYGNIPLSDSYKGLLGIQQWIYFCFFLTGTLVRKHFHLVQQKLDGRWLITLCVLVYFLLNFYRSTLPDVGLIKVPVNLLCSLAGILILFAFFRANQSSFSKDRAIGRVLQYVGRRTLDIYLLHYFFLPQGLGDAFPVFVDYPMPVVEAVCSFIIAIVIVALCLLMSNIIRLSPVLARWLFGVKVS